MAVKVTNKTKKKDRDVVTFVDLFAGIGGFHLGVKNAAKKTKREAKCVLAVDIDKKAKTTYLNNFEGTPFREDVTDPLVKKFIKRELPKDIDIICGGFPCQPFSLAGKKLGIEDDRGTLFEHIVEILEIARPKAVFLENVRNLKSIKNNDGSSVFEHITDKLKKAGYQIEWDLFKATEFGLPTHRPRIYMVGFRKDILSNPKDFPWPEHAHKSAPTLSEFFKGLDKKWDVKRRGWPNRVGNTIRVGGMGSGFRPKEGGGYRRDKRNWDSYMFFENKNNNKEGIIHELSVTEAKAMMGFPIDYSFGELSRAQSMRQLGNSVAIPVIEAIAEKIIEIIHDRPTHA